MTYINSKDYGYINSDDDDYKPDLLCQIQNRKVFMGEAPGRNKVITRKNKVISRDLKLDLFSIKKLCINHIICLVEDHEFIKYNMGNYISLVEDSKIKISHYPIKDGGIPSLELIQQIMLDMNHSIVENNILIHCMAGIGRTGLVASCFLVDRGFDPKTAIAITQERRRNTITRKNQQEFIYLYQKIRDSYLSRK